VLIRRWRFTGCAGTASGRQRKGLRGVRGTGWFPYRLVYHCFMMRGLLLLLALVAAAVLRAQEPVQVYSTAADWKAGKPKASYPRYKGFGMTFGQPYLMVNNEPGGKIRNVSLKKVWGYTKAGKLFRWDRKKPARHVVLQREGVVCAWTSTAGGVSEDNMASDYLLFISVGLDGELIPLPHGLRSPPQGRYNSFVREEREGPLAVLVACLETTDQLEKAKACIERFNEGHQGRP
jgi:hypothetical protein